VVTPRRGKQPPTTALETDVRRGEIVQVNLDPARGSEANKTRPAVVVSNDAANAAATRLGRGVITVVPVTSSTGHVYPFQVLLPARQTGLPRDSKAQAEQVRSIAVERVGQRVGQLPVALIAELDHALRVHLSL
jgi:mRNA interferase MazF